MITIRFGGYNYLSLHFLANSIEPPCEYFEVPLNKKKCKRCAMRLACRDMANIITLCEKVTAELPSTNIRLTHMPK